jgi:predicted ATP-binding protein involved in virulence
MKIKHIEIRNFRGIKHLKLDLLSNLNVFVGVNGSGKSTVLDAIVNSISWLVYRIQSTNANGKLIHESSIRNGEDQSFLGITVESGNHDFSWRLVRSRKGNESKEKSELEQVSELALDFQKQFKASHSLLVVAFYPVNRMVETKTPDFGNGESVDIFDVYKDSLGGKANFQSFFEWFRLQDDIKNEQLQSKSQWIAHNSQWIQERFDGLIRSLRRFSPPSDSLYQLAEAALSNPLVFEDTRFLLLEMSELLNSFEGHFEEDTFPTIKKLPKGLGEIFKAFAKLPSSKKDPFAIPPEILQNKLSSYLRGFEQVFRDEPLGERIFVGEWIELLLLTTFWWIKNVESKKKIEDAISGYFEKLEATFPRTQKAADLIEFILAIAENEKLRLQQAGSGGRNLEIVTKAIEAFVPEFSNLRVTRIPSAHMLVEKKGKTIRVNQLSDGEKNMIALVGDIARRLSLANSNSENPLEGYGIILIDEIDLHLHPLWQRLIVPKLTEVFPNCQFIVTTHSPQVLSHVQPENIFILSQVDDEISFSKPTDSFGMNSDRILEDLMDVDARPIETKLLLNALFRSIQLGTIEDARQKLAELQETIANDPELVKANVLIKRKEAIGK